MVISMLFLATLGVLAAIAVPGYAWIGIAGWAVALVALSAALWTLFGHARRENRRYRD